MSFSSSELELFPEEELELLSSSQPQPESQSDSEPLTSSGTSEYEPKSSQYSDSSSWSEHSQVSICPIKICTTLFKLLPSLYNIYQPQPKSQQLLDFF